MPYRFRVILFHYPLACLLDSKIHSVIYIFNYSLLSSHLPEYPYFVEWLMRYQLDRAVVVALGDVEGYVRASAFTVLANVISIHKVWFGVCVCVYLCMHARLLVVQEGERGRVEGTQVGRDSCGAGLL